jgi:uncharacterized protein
MKLNLPHDQIAEFCRKWNVSELALFGSVLRDDFRPESDVDVLVSFPSYEATPSLFDHVDMQDELEAVFGRKVDVVNRKGVEQSTNRFRKQAILGSALTIYPPDAAVDERIEGALPAEPLDRSPALLYEMLEAARLARDFTDGMTPEQFARNRMSVSAVSRVLGQMGYASGKVSIALRDRHPQIDWLGMAAFADRLLQQYRDVSPHEVWAAAMAAAEAIPILEPLIPTVENENDEQTK